MGNASRFWSLVGLASAAVGIGGALCMAGQFDSGVPFNVSARLADRFDYPIGRPDGIGYHKARGFTPNGHLGEDWNGNGGGDTDLGDPIYAIGNGVVVLARDVRVGWGNVIIVRHSYREPLEGDVVKTIDSLYGHLDSILVQEGQQVARGQQIATMGTAHGQYDAHLHFEIRKNLTVGMNRSAFPRDFQTYWDPTQFLNSHRVLHGGGGTQMAVNTFVPYPGAGFLPPSDAAYELGINRSPQRLAALQSAKLDRSAYAIKRRTPFDKINDSFKADRYDDMRSPGR